jgi:hypothetical protein
LKRTRLPGRYDENSLDLLWLVLVRGKKFSLVPELLEIFGKKATYDFLRVFSGKTVEVPSAKELEASIRDVKVYMTLRRGVTDGLLQSLAKEYDLTSQEVRQLNSSMEKLVEESGVGSVFK